MRRGRVEWARTNSTARFSPFCTCESEQKSWKKSGESNICSQWHLLQPRPLLHLGPERGPDGQELPLLQLILPVELLVGDVLVVRVSLDLCAQRGILNEASDVRAIPVEGGISGTNFDQNNCCVSEQTRSDYKVYD